MCILLQLSSHAKDQLFFCNREVLPQTWTPALDSKDGCYHALYVTGEMQDVCRRRDYVHTQGDDRVPALLGGFWNNDCHNKVADRSHNTKYHEHLEMWSVRLRAN